MNTIYHRLRTQYSDGHNHQGTVWVFSTLYQAWFPQLCCTGQGLCVEGRCREDQRVWEPSWCFWLERAILIMYGLYEYDNIYISIYLSTYLSTYLSICLSIYLYANDDTTTYKGLWNQQTGLSNNFSGQNERFKPWDGGIMGDHIQTNLHDSAWVKIVDPQKWMA